MDFADIEWLIGALFAFIPGIIDFLGDAVWIKITYGTSGIHKWIDV